MNGLRITVTVNDGPLEEKADAIGYAIYSQLVSSTEDVVDLARSIAPTDEGVLKNSLTSEVMNDSEGRMEAHIGSNLEYAPYVEYGTGPVGRADPEHLQGATYSATGWTYYNAKAGHFVHTEGQRPNRFLTHSMEALSDKIQADMDHAIVEACR